MLTTAQLEETEQMAKDYDLPDYLAGFRLAAEGRLEPDTMILLLKTVHSHGVMVGVREMGKHLHGALTEELKV